jgi:hypothetical protein
MSRYSQLLDECIQSSQINFHRRIVHNFVPVTPIELCSHCYANASVLLYKQRYILCYDSVQTLTSQSPHHQRLQRID